MTGDCEDFAIFFCFLLDTKLKIYSELVRIKNNKICHIIVYIPDNNFYIDVTNDGIMDPSDLEDYNIKWYCPYSEAMWMTINYHDSVGKYR